MSPHPQSMSVARPAGTVLPSHCQDFLDDYSDLCDEVGLDDEDPRKVTPLARYAPNSDLREMWKVQLLEVMVLETQRRLETARSSSRLRSHDQVHAQHPPASTSPPETAPEVYSSVRHAKSPPPEFRLDSPIPVPPRYHTSPTARTPTTPATTHLVECYISEPIPEKNRAHTRLAYKIRKEEHHCSGEETRLRSLTQQRTRIPRHHTR